MAKIWQSVQHYHTLLSRFTLSVMYQPIVLMDKLPFNDYSLYMISTSYVAVLYHTRILYRTSMVHTIRVWYVLVCTIRVWYNFVCHTRTV